MLSVKQGSIKYHFLSLWYDSTWDWTAVSRTIGEHSTHSASYVISFIFNFPSLLLLLSHSFFHCVRNIMYLLFLIFVTCFTRCFFFLYIELFLMEQIKEWGGKISSVLFCSPGQYLNTDFRKTTSLKGVVHSPTRTHTQIMIKIYNYIIIFLLCVDICSDYWR